MEWTIPACADNDVILFTNNTVVLTIAPGHDSVSFTLVNTANVPNAEAVLLGGSGSNVLDGGAGNDVVFGGNGNDILKAEAGNSYLFGGTGNDTFYLSGGGTKVISDANPQHSSLFLNDTSLTGTYIQSGASWVSLDGSITLSDDSGWQITDTQGDTIQLNSFTSGDMFDRNHTSAKSLLTSHRSGCNGSSYLSMSRPPAGNNEWRMAA